MRSPTKAGTTSPGRQAARDAWLAQHPRVLVIGMLGCTAPLLDTEVGFYVASLGCDWTESKIQFVDDYNAELKQLVEEQGYPEWGPLCPRPSRTDALDKLNHADEFRAVIATLDLRPHIRRSIRAWIGTQTGEGRTVHWDPRSATADAASEVLIVGGSWGNRAALVQIYDLREQTWMARYEYRRIHVSRFPWE